MFLHFQSQTPRQKEAFQCFNKLQQDHLRMNVAPDRTIILGLQIVLDHRSLSSIGQKILVIRHPHGRDWDGWIVIIGSLRAPSVLIMHA